MLHFLQGAFMGCSDEGELGGQSGRLEKSQSNVH